MFLSLKKHWAESDCEREEALFQFALSLMRGMKILSAGRDSSAANRLHTEVLAIETALVKDPRPEILQEAARSLPLAMQKLASDTDARYQDQIVQLRDIISLLTGAFKSVAATSDASIDHLGQIENRIESISHNAEWKLLRSELATAIASIQEEALHQREETRRTIQSLSRSISDSRPRTSDCAPAQPPSPPADDVSALAGRTEAELALADLEPRAGAFLVVLPVDRHPLIQMRFGHEAGEDVLRFFTGHLRRHFPHPDRLFRWSPRAIVALIRRKLPSDALRVEIARFASHKLEHRIEHHGREVLLPIYTSWTLLPASDCPSTANLVRRIDSFLHDGIHAKDKF